MIIMNDDDENDNNERPTHPLASEIQGQLCQALKSTMRAHLCVYVCAFVSVWPSGCHCATDFTSNRCLVIYLFMYSFICFFQAALTTCPCLQQKAAALCGHFTVRWSGFVWVLVCASVLGRVMSKDLGRACGFKM